jgi:outer membrane protein assembly factor BamD
LIPFEFMKSDLRSQSISASLAFAGAILLAAVFLPACLFHPNRNQDLGVPVTPNSQPDKMLLQKAQAEIDHGRYEVGRLTLQVLINTYPDSEYLAKAKLMTAESYYKEGGISGLTQAEAEYKDFITFFPTAAEAPMAEYRAGMCHFRLMGKADRDLTEARDAQDEFKIFLEKYPDNSMVPVVKGRLREVQEVLAEGDYETALLYYRRGAQRAAASRLQEIADSYPNFSQADQALWFLGQAQEKLHKQDQAAAAYSRLLTDYPLSTSAQTAKVRLVAMKRPVPKATKATLARAEADRAVEKQHKPALIARAGGLFTGSPDLDATRHGPVHLGASPPPLEQAAAPKSPAAAGSIAVQPVPDSGAASQAPPSTGDEGSRPAPADSAGAPPAANPNPGSETAPAANPPVAAAPAAGAPPATNTAAPDSAKSGQPASDPPAGASTSSAGKSAKAQDKSAKSDQPAAATSDPPKKGKFHFLKKLIP